MKKEEFSLIIVDGVAMLYRLEMGDAREEGDENIKKINLYSISKIVLNLKSFIMTKKELVNAIAADAGLSIKDAGKALNAFVGAFGKSMKKGERIQLPGLGTFKVDKRHDPYNV